MEQVFCPSTSPTGRGIDFADLRQDSPVFRSVSLDEVKQLNPLVGQIIRCPHRPHSPGRSASRTPPPLLLAAAPLIRAGAGVFSLRVSGTACASEVPTSRVWKEVRRWPGRGARHSSGSRRCPATSQCRWGPVERPVEPIRWRLPPGDALPQGDGDARSVSVHAVSPAPWSSFTPLPRMLQAPAKATTPPGGMDRTSRRLRPGLRLRAVRRRRPPRPGRRTSGAPLAR